MEKTITMPLSEFEELKKINSTILEIVGREEKVMCFMYFHKVNGWCHVCVIGESELIKDLKDKNIQQRNLIDELYEKILSLKSKSRWQRFKEVFK